MFWLPWSCAGLIHVSSLCDFTDGCGRFSSLLWDRSLKKPVACHFDIKPLGSAYLSHLQCWGYQHVSLYPVFIGVAGIQTQKLMLSHKYFIQWTIFWSLNSIYFFVCLLWKENIFTQVFARRNVWSDLCFRVIPLDQATNGIEAMRVESPGDVGGIADWGQQFGSHDSREPRWCWWHCWLKWKVQNDERVGVWERFYKDTTCLLRPWMSAKGRERPKVIVNEEAAYWYAWGSLSPPKNERRLFRGALQQTHRCTHARKISPSTDKIKYLWRHKKQLWLF